MQKVSRLKVLSITFPLMLILAVLGAACGGSQPEAREIPVKFTAGQLEPGTIRVGQNDTVTLKIESDEPGSFHLHGYDIEQEVGPDGVTDFVFVADASGRFRIAFHPAGEEHGSHETGHQGSHEEAGHGDEFQSEVIHPGETFSLEVTHEMTGKTFSYHSHLHPEVSGTVHVAEDAPAADTVEVSMIDGATDPPEVTVRPGTTIIWTNNSSEMQALASGKHPGSTEEGHGEDTGQGHEEGEEEEIDVGFLEVQPR